MKRQDPAVLTAAAVFLVCAAFPAPSLDALGAHYLVAAREGFHLPAAATHPFYLVWLKAWALLGAATGAPIALPQLANAAAFAAGIGFLAAAAGDAARDKAAGAAAALLFAAQPGAWTYATHLDPYAPACALGALALWAALRGEAAAAGLALGLACGFDAKLVAGLPALAVLFAREPRAAGRFSLVFAAAAAAAYLPAAGLHEDLMHAQGEPRFPSVLRGGGVVPMARSVAGLAWRLCPDWLWIVPAAWFAAGLKPRVEARLVLSGILFAAFLFAGLTLSAATNPFIYVAGLFLPPALACLAPRRALAWMAAALILRVGVVDALPAARTLSPAAAEARFIAAELGPDGVLAIAGACDWRLCLRLQPRVELVRFDTGGQDLFAPPREALSQEAWSALDAALAAGRPVLVAQDSLVTPRDIWSHRRIARWRDRLFPAIDARYARAGVAVSPAGQYYIRLAQKR